MMLNVYSIYDKDTGKYGQPFFAETDAVAKRQFLIGCKSLPKEILVALKFFRIAHVDMDTIDFSNDSEFIMSGDDVLDYLENENKKESN